MNGPGLRKLTPNVPRRPLHRHRPREVAQPGLRGAVGADVGSGAVGSHRPDVDNAPPAAVTHDRRDLLAHAQRPFQVHGEHLAPVLEGHVARRHQRRADPRVVDQHVDASEALVTASTNPGMPSQSPTWQASGEDIGAGGGPNLLGHRVAEVLLPGAHHHCGAGCSQSLDHGPTDPLGGPGNDRHLAGQIEQLCRGVSWHSRPGLATGPGRLDGNVVIISTKSSRADLA